MAKIPNYPTNQPENKPQLQGAARRIETRPSTASKFKSVTNSLWYELVIPAGKNLIWDFIRNTLEAMILGNDSRSGYYQTGSRASYGQRPMVRSYNKAYVGYGRQAGKSFSQNVLEDFENIMFDDRRDAEHILGLLINNIATYGRATVGDLYSLTGQGPNSPTAQRWGWRNLSGVRVEQFAAGEYVIALPNPIYLD